MSYKIECGENVMQEHSDEAKPATSCHVWWKPEVTGNVDLDSEFELSCTAVVSKREPCTYFALIGYHGGQSGGYGGIQEDEEGRNIFLFSVWDSPTSKTVSIGNNHDSECIIRRFGGEGVGMQCLLYKKWEIGQEIKQIIRGKYISGDEKSQTWHISCSFEVNGHKYEMATYEWSGESRPLPKPEFYSFVEDWNRQPNAQVYYYYGYPNFIYM